MTKRQNCAFHEIRHRSLSQFSFKLQAFMKFKTTTSQKSSADHFPNAHIFGEYLRMRMRTSCGRASHDSQATNSPAREEVFRITDRPFNSVPFPSPTSPAELPQHHPFDRILRRHLSRCHPQICYRLGQPLVSWRRLCILRECSLGLKQAYSFCLKSQISRRSGPRAALSAAGNFVSIVRHRH